MAPAVPEDLPELEEDDDVDTDDIELDENKLDELEAQ